jgi:RimJ/RimL family protein N-acetyltransferase
MAAIRLERMGPQHSDATFDWLQDDTLRTAIDSHGAPDRDRHEAYWRMRLARPHEESYAVLADGAHVGNGGLVVDRARRKAELWLYLGDPSVRGAGVGTDAANLLLTRAFDELGLNRAAVRVVSTNEGALRFWRSLGFVEEGRLREDAGDADSVWLGMLRSEWEHR